MCTGKRQTHIRNAPSSRTAVTGIGPYKFSANPYCLANFKRKADLPQPFKGNCLQICCTVTGGVYHSAPFLPILFRQDGKEWAVGDIPQYHIPTKVPNQTGELP